MHVSTCDRSILARKPYSSHPDDSYLSVVLCEFSGQFVTWIFNSYDNGYSLGHYFVTLTDALKDFNKRGNL